MRTGNGSGDKCHRGWVHVVREHAGVVKGYHRKNKRVRRSMRNSKAQATRRTHVAPRLTAKAIVPQPTEEAQELPLELFLEDDELGAPLDEAVGSTPEWTGMDIQEDGIEDLMSD